ncbi:hypothetical protein F4780DRAFT_509987 [Xylariomycetidae sp. FL0641]|nr:hypothetical protein F4780DRAFT_509987 [Xylariomycetidae sp. FL0641]
MYRPIVEGRGLAGDGRCWVSALLLAVLLAGVDGVGHGVQSSAREGQSRHRCGVAHWQTGTTLPYRDTQDDGTPQQTGSRALHQPRMAAQPRRSGLLPAGPYARENHQTDQPRAEHSPA